ncbi:MAG TPA: M20 aminoacylase family protein [Rhodopila sp.]|uniref:M20 aminoacylase family protein n=1 Tax=Rhodopila sp. TaxID=2480087 RepID=UPI002B7CE112|nr:M20 aminoacylase family protein [Rhodopila sp.]HVY17551.1 M20 aminoacylase family protein [Rhodopila sp.]
MTDAKLDRIRAYQEELAAIRRDIHAHPELGMEEYRTSDLVAAKLAEWGIEVHRDVGKTGVVGVLRNGNGQAAIGLRADRDALPIQEATGLPYASRTPGVMHACGHDGHTTILLGAAKYLAETRNFNGTVNLIFQPAEEGLGGAEAMLKDGLFQRFPCDAIYGLHNSPGLDVGRFVSSSGARFAGCAFFDIHITGKGAHGARPNEGIDPVMVAAHLATALQTIVSRNLPAQDAAVLSVTRIQSGDAYNVVPETAVLAGTVRCFKTAIMETIETNMRRLATSVATGFGAEAEVAFRRLFAPVINDKAEAALYADAAEAVTGPNRVFREMPPTMASEDFGAMMEVVPGAHVHFGNGPSAGVHNHRYDFNDEAIPYAAALFAEIAERKLRTEA